MPWAFDNTNFAVAADGPIFDEWFIEDELVTIDPILGADARYVDIGATSREPLEVVAQFTTTAARDAILDLRGSVATLEDDDGRSCEALLRRAVPIRVKAPDSGIYRAGLTFEYVSAS